MSWSRSFTKLSALPGTRQLERCTTHKPPPGSRGTLLAANRISSARLQCAQCGSSLFVRLNQPPPPEQEGRS